MGFLKKILKNKIFKAVAPIALNFIPGVGPALSAAAGAYLGSRDGGGVLGGITGAAGGYFGGAAAKGALSGFAGIGPGMAGGFGGALTGAAGGLSSAAGYLGGALGLSGGTVGNASNILGALGMFGTPSGSIGNQKQALAGQKTEIPFKAKRPDEMARPANLNAMAGFSPEQERSALATQGMNGGLGGQEQSYYDNLVQRALIADGGQINTENPNSLLPIESSYYSRRGKNTSNISEFLRSFA